MTVELKPIFTHTVSLEKELLNKFENDLDFFPSAKFFVIHSSTKTSCQYSATILKGQIFQDKHNVRSSASVLRKKVEIMIFKTSPKLLEDMLEKATYLDKATGPIC